MAARTGERCYWWCSQGLQVIQLHMVQNPTMYILSNYTINWHITPYQCHITCYTGGYQSNCVVVGVAARVAETLNKKSHQGDAMGGRKPPATLMPQTIIAKQYPFFGRWPFFWEKVYCWVLVLSLSLYVYGWYASMWKAANERVI